MQTNNDGFMQYECKDNEYSDMDHAGEIGKFRANLTLSKIEDEMQREIYNSNDSSKKRFKLSLFKKRQCDSSSKQKNRNGKHASTENVSIKKDLVGIELEKLYTDLESQRSLCHDLQKQKDSLEVTLDQKAKEENSNIVTIANLVKENKDLHDTKELLNEKFTSTLKRKQDLDMILEEKDHELEKQKMLLCQLEKSIETMASEKEDIENKHCEQFTLSKKISELKVHLNHKLKEMLESETLIKELKENVATLMKEKSDLHIALQERKLLDNQCSELKEELTQKDKDLDVSNLALVDLKMKLDNKCEEEIQHIKKMNGIGNQIQEFILSMNILEENYIEQNLKVKQYQINIQNVCSEIDQMNKHLRESEVKMEKERREKLELEQRHNAYIDMWSDLTSLATEFYATTHKHEVIDTGNTWQQLTSPEEFDAILDMLRSSIKSYLKLYSDFGTISSELESKRCILDEDAGNGTNNFPQGAAGAANGLVDDQRTKDIDSERDNDKMQEDYEAKLREALINTNSKQHKLLLQNEEMKMQKEFLEDALKQKRKEASRLNFLNENLSDQLRDMQESFVKKIEAHSIVNREVLEKNKELDKRCKSLKEELSIHMKSIGKMQEYTDEFKLQQSQKQKRFYQEQPTQECIAEKTCQDATSSFNVESLNDEVQLIRSQLTLVKRKSCEQDQKLLGLRKKLLAREQELKDKDYEICKLQKELHVSSATKQTPKFYSSNMHQYCNHFNNSNVSPSIFYKEPSQTQEHLHRHLSMSSTVPEAMLFSKRLSAGNEMILSTFKEGHSIIQDIFKEKDRLQHEIEEARQARQRK